MFVRKRTLCTVAAIAGTALVAATVAPAAASSSAPPQLKVVKTLSSAFVGPLQFAVNGKQVVVADDATSTLSQLGVAAPIATNPGANHEIAGVGIDPATGAIAYTTATSVGAEGVHTASSVVIKQAGKPDVVADTFGFEQSHNPDRIIRYGVVRPSRVRAQGTDRGPHSGELQGTTRHPPLRGHADRRRGLGGRRRRRQ